MHEHLKSPHCTLSLRERWNRNPQTMLLVLVSICIFNSMGKVKLSEVEDIKRHSEW